jgi:hypothetical protein
VRLLAPVRAGEQVFIYYGNLSSASQARRHLAPLGAAVRFGVCSARNGDACCPSIQCFCAQLIRFGFCDMEHQEDTVRPISTLAHRFCQRSAALDPVSYFGVCCKVPFELDQDDITELQRAALAKWRYATGRVRVEFSHLVCLSVVLSP